MTKIMLIEDDPTMQMLLKTLLEIEGFSVFPWDVVMDPILEMSEISPDIVLLDVNLKGYNGFEVLKKIRGDDQLKSCKVIMSSGMNYQVESVENGADNFIMKPYMPDDLIRLIKQ